MSIRERILALPHVLGISDERGLGDGIWVYYKGGFKSSSDPIGVLHLDHEDTWPELYSAAKSAIPCQCGDGCRELEPKPLQEVR